MKFIKNESISTHQKIFLLICKVVILHNYFGCVLIFNYETFFCAPLKYNFISFICKRRRKKKEFKL